MQGCQLLFPIATTLYCIKENSVLMCYFLKDGLFLCVLMFLSVCMYVEHVCQKKVSESLELELQIAVKSPCVCWERNLGLLREQQVFLKLRIQLAGLHIC